MGGIVASNAILWNFLGMLAISFYEEIDLKEICHLLVIDCPI